MTFYLCVPGAEAPGFRRKMSRPVSFQGPVNLNRSLTVAIRTFSGEAFSKAVQRDFIAQLREVIDLKYDCGCFQKNYLKKVFFVTLRNKPAYEAVLQKGEFSVGGVSWAVEPASPLFLTATVHWAPDELEDKVIAEALREYGQCIGVRKPAFSDPEMANIQTGVRYYRIKCHKERYVPNFINFANNTVTVMFTYPGQIPECRKCGQQRHKARDCRAEFCLNCNGFTPHDNPHTEVDCMGPCRHCGNTIHTISQCNSRRDSYAARTRQKDLESDMEGPGLFREKMRKDETASVSEPVDLSATCDPETNGKDVNDGADVDDVNAGCVNVTGARKRGEVVASDCYASHRVPGDVDVSDVGGGEVGSENVAVDMEAPRCDELEESVTGEKRHFDVDDADADDDVNLWSTEEELMDMESESGNADNANGSESHKGNTDNVSGNDLSGLASQKKQKLDEDQTDKPGTVTAESSSAASSYDTVHNDADESADESMTPVPSQDSDPWLIQYRRKNPFASRAGRRKKKV